MYGDIVIVIAKAAKHECYALIMVLKRVADADVQLCNVAGLDESFRHALEADCFWCFSKLLDGIQDNYTFAQPGIQTRINSLKELVGRIDSKLLLSVK